MLLLIVLLLIIFNLQNKRKHKLKKNNKKIKYNKFVNLITSIEQEKDRTKKYELLLKLKSVIFESKIKCK